MEGIHPSRLLQIMQQPVEDGEASLPQPVQSCTGSNNVPLGQRMLPCAEPDFDPHLADTRFVDSCSMYSVELDEAISTSPYFDKEDKRVGSSRALPHDSARRFQSLARSNNPELLAYLSHRKISAGFLHEIDQFLQDNPELFHYASEFANRFNCSSPLNAYREFLKGYTKPARYVHGILPDPKSFSLPQCYVPSRLSSTYDEELVDYFSGDEYRDDILQEIDEIVDAFCDKMQAGLFVTVADRKLIIYALWGNPVDAYKYYEYNYQTKWLRHRYLPEHIELLKVPKDDSSIALVNSVLGPDEGSRGHRLTRLRMARANDEGIDPIVVLLEDFVRELATKGHRRNHIATMEREAKSLLNKERADPQGYDIVELIMSLADSEPRVRSTVRSFASAPTSFGRAMNAKSAKFAMANNSTGNGADVSMDFMGDITVKGEVSTPMDSKKDFNSSATPLRQRRLRNNFILRRSLLIGATREEQLLVNGGFSQDMIILARRKLISAERQFVISILGLDKIIKQLTGQEINKLQNILDCFKGKVKKLPDEKLNGPRYRALTSDLLARYGEFLS